MQPLKYIMVPMVPMVRVWRRVINFFQFQEQIDRENGSRQIILSQMIKDDYIFQSVNDR